MWLITQTNVCSEYKEAGTFCAVLARTSPQFWDGKRNAPAGYQDLGKLNLQGGKVRDKG